MDLKILKFSFTTKSSCRNKSSTT